MPKGVYLRTEKHREILKRRCLSKALEKTVRGDSHCRWRGENVGNTGLHLWVVRMLGSPKVCWECGTTDEAKWYHWANISGEYKRLNGLKDWKRLCVKCHKAFDNNTPNGENHYRAKLTEDDVLKIRRLYVPRVYTLEKLAKQFGVDDITIFNIVKRERWKHI